ncbi:hypothetical protein [Caballeronia pedi]|nr:hypothetical protein [Caballeronia pedi]
MASATVYCSVEAAAAGGVIYFSGALVAPPFNVSVEPSGGSRISATAGTHMTETGGRTTYVTFLPDPHNPPKAELTLSTASGAGRAGTVTATFKDGKGRLVKPDAAGKYEVGPLGGTLSMRAHDYASPSAEGVTLVTIYD